MLPGKLSEINAATLQAACADQWPETATLDFKLALPGNTDPQREEFLKDVAAFANASGGDLVYGVAETTARASRLKLIVAATNAPDAEKRRLGQLLDGGIEPRIPGIELQAVPIQGADYVLIVRVPSSFLRPHCCKAGSFMRWPVRAGTRTAYFTYDQLRDAFDRTATLQQRATQFRAERLAGILAGTKGRPLRRGAKCVVHLIPLAAIAGKVSIDVRALYQAGVADFMFRDWGGGSRALNLDGYVTHPGDHRAGQAYIQVFRSGVMETARHIGAVNGPEGEEGRLIPSITASQLIRDAIEMFIRSAQRLGINGPAIISVAILDALGYLFAFAANHGFMEQRPVDRAEMIFPEQWIEQIGDLSDIDAVARPLLNTLWQAFDIEQCYLYSESGTWQPG